MFNCPLEISLIQNINKKYIQFYAIHPSLFDFIKFYSKMSASQNQPLFHIGLGQYWYQYRKYLQVLKKKQGICIGKYFCLGQSGWETICPGLSLQVSILLDLHIIL